MKDLIIQFQNSIFTMLSEKKLTQQEFDILANLSKNISNETVLDLILKLNLDDFKDKNVIDSILNGHFKTALIICGGETNAAACVNQTN